ncbi:lipid-A-disaccharide synthase [Sedimenticola sp.]|uniref:lipid-A-disaccharide synthase n=1 Tax=Sedimenticola sp. TaxID=1940285 RepID=UPI003D129640
MLIAIVAGEASGDQLGAGLIQAIRERVPDARFIGVAGDRMQSVGCEAFYHSDELALLGLFEVLGQLPRVMRLRRDLIKRLVSEQPDVVIGIDAPDFNLGLETRLKAKGIPTVHYVSPTVWAWRKRRVHRIRRAVDLLLSIFPFEVEFLQRYGVPVKFVGHPLADRLPMHPDRQEARERLGLGQADEIVAILPGSRGSELQQLGVLFLRAAQKALETRPGLKFIIPMANKQLKGVFEVNIKMLGAELPIKLLDGQSHEAMIAADRVLTASGTATLEAALLKRPMVVAYRFPKFTYWLLKHLVKIPHMAMANLLAGKRLVPEFLQDEATPENLSNALLKLFENRDLAESIIREFEEIHRNMSLGADRLAAKAVIDLVGAGNRGGRNATA